MKYPILLSILFIQVLNASAQETKLPTPRERNREIGILGETMTTNSNYDDQHMIGLQYKKWKNSNFGYRVMAAYGEYNYRANGNSIAQIVGDTFIQKSPMTRVDMAIVGLGLEAQRHFYKRIYFFAALELKGGYGIGDVDTMVSKTYRENQGVATYGVNTGPKQEASSFFVNAAPTIGAKFQFSHICFGAEMVSNMLTVRGVSYKNAAGITWTDMDLTKVSTRIFFSYKF